MCELQSEVFKRLAVIIGNEVVDKDERNPWTRIIVTDIMKNCCSR